jgi:hypothetical protein
LPARDAAEDLHGDDSDVVFPCHRQDFLFEGVRVAVGEIHDRQHDVHFTRCQELGKASGDA